MRDATVRETVVSRIGGYSNARVLRAIRCSGFRSHRIDCSGAWPPSVGLAVGSIFRASWRATLLSVWGWAARPGSPVRRPMSLGAAIVPTSQSANLQMFGHDKRPSKALALARADMGRSASAQGTTSWHFSGYSLGSAQLMISTVEFLNLTTLFGLSAVSTTCRQERVENQ